MASSDNNNNANEPRPGPEKDAIPTTSVESVEQAKEEVKSEPVTEPGEKHSADKSGEGVVERTEEKKLESDVTVPAESSARISPGQKPSPVPAAEQSAIAPDTTAQPSTTGESKSLPAHPVEESSVGSQKPKNDTNNFNAQESQPSTLAPKPSNVETQQPKFEIENAPTEQFTHTAREELEDAGPSVTITLLLTTGARHPFKINGRYLRKRSIDVPDYDPFKMSVYTLKELILREWRTGTSRSFEKIGI